MTQNNVLFGIIGLLVGLAVGFFIANSLNKNAFENPATSQIPTNQTGLPQQVQQNPGQRPAGGMQADVQKTLDKAEDEPENFQAQIDAGRMYAQIQSFDKALVFFEKAQALKPDDFAANAMLGNAYFDAQKFDKAGEYYAKALEIKPKDVTVRSDYATTFFQKENPDYDKAIAEFNKVLEIDPKHEPTLYNLSLAYKRLGDSENAQSTFEKLKKTNPDSNLIQRLKNILDK